MRRLCNSVARASQLRERMIDVDDGFRILRVSREVNDASDASEQQPRPRKNRRAREARPDGVAAISAIEADLRPQIVLVASNVAAEVRKRPVLAVAIAIGVGFALGGALSMRLGRSALGAAARLALKRIAATHG